MSPQTFGRRLREQREHHRLTIEAIAASTKIKASLLAGLERGDIADWPAGIFQRAFVREYARAVGLSPEPVLADFLCVFAADTGSAGASRMGGELRLTLALEPDGISPFRTQALAALIEAVGIGSLAAITSWIAATGFGTTCSAFAFLYYPIAVAWLGTTPATWYLKREPTVPNQGRNDDASLPAAAEKREGLYLVKPTGESERPAAAEEAAGVDSDSPRRVSAMR